MRTTSPARAMRACIEPRKNLAWPSWMTQTCAAVATLALDDVQRHALA
jgi:hypothetical protein